MTAAVKESPENFNLHYRLGVAHDHLGAHDKAIEVFRRPLALRPDEIKVHRSLGFAFEQQGNPDPPWRTSSAPTNWGRLRTRAADPSRANGFRLL